MEYEIHGLAAAFVEHDSDLVGGAADAADDKLFSGESGRKMSLSSA